VRNVGHERAYGVDQRLGVGVRMVANGVQHRCPGTGNPQLRRAQRLLGSHGPTLASLLE
jgi:hypothetical protein